MERLRAVSMELVLALAGLVGAVRATRDGGEAGTSSGLSKYGRPSPRAPRILAGLVGAVRVRHAGRAA